jgi:hypothetical protein
MDTFSNYVEIPIVGILPIKFEDNTWLTKITKGKDIVYLVNMGSYTSDFIDFKMTVNDSIVR